MQDKELKLRKGPEILAITGASQQETAAILGLANTLWGINAAT